MSQKEADEVADQLFSGQGASMTLDEVMAYAAQLREENQKQLAE